MEDKTLELSKKWLNFKNHVRKVVALTGMASIGPTCTQTEGLMRELDVLLMEFMSSKETKE